MAISSKLKTAAGDYYATEKYVDSSVETLSGVVSGQIFEQSGQINEILDDLNVKADKENVYTKEETNLAISSFFEFRTL